MQGRSLELDFTEDYIKELIVKHRGRLSWMADEMGVHRKCLYDYVDIHNLHELVKRARFYKKEERNDTAEQVLEKLIELVDTDPNLAFKSATYILEAHAKDRGYGKVVDDSEAKQLDKELQQTDKELPQDDYQKPETT